MFSGLQGELRPASRAPPETPCTSGRGAPPVRPEPCGSSLRPRAAATAAARAPRTPVRAAVGLGGQQPGVRGARRDPGDPELPGRASALSWCARRAAPPRPPGARPLRGRGGSGALPSPERRRRALNERRRLLGWASAASELRAKRRRRPRLHRSAWLAGGWAGGEARAMAAAAVRGTGGRADCGALTVPWWRRPRRRRLNLAGEPDGAPLGQPHPLPGRVPAPRSGPRRGDLLRGRTARGARGERRRRGRARTRSGGASRTAAQSARSGRNSFAAWASAGS